MIPAKAIQAAHAAVCEQSLDDCLDPDWRGKCVKAVEAAAPHIKCSDRRPSVVTDAANRVAYFLNWHQGDNDIAANFPSGPSLYASDLQVILNELKAGGAM